MPALALAHDDSPLFDREALIRNHMDLARRLARKIARRVPRSVSAEELESAAMLGLTEAATRFDPTRGEPFIAYAAKRVRGAVLDELRRNDVLTRRGREDARWLAESIRAVEAETGRAATTEEIAAKMGITVDEVAKFRARLHAPALVPLEEIRESPRVGGDDAPDTLCALREQKRVVARALQDLPKRDLLVISMYYQDGLTLKEIGSVLGVSESRACQLRSRALKKLRGMVVPKA